MRKRAPRLSLFRMVEETPGNRLRLPTAPMLLEVAAVALAELEGEHPGLIDRMIARLSWTSLRATVAQVRAPTGDDVVVHAQHDALVWLTTIAPLLRADTPRGKHKHRRRR